ncbi:hypothetical protein [Sphingomonas sp. 3-13AW]|uniref:hypothetical protein n=1 Tax=Sphingomonas sp. 3-13AW TaxID=3050450 RepID=UPI003BB5D0C1
MRFSCASFDCPPDDLIYTGNESGWEMRRLITDWCTRNAVTEYRILRNTSYHRDLHGPRVYELWTKTNQKQKRKRI